MTKKKPRYELRVFDGRIIHSAEIERIHKEVLDFKRIEAISQPMRELIEDLWPELANKLPPKAIDSHGTHHAAQKLLPAALEPNEMLPGRLSGRDRAARCL